MSFFLSVDLVMLAASFVRLMLGQGRGPASGGPVPPDRRAEPVGTRLADR